MENKISNHINKLYMCTIEKPVRVRIFKYLKQYTAPDRARQMIKWL